MKTINENYKVISECGYVFYERQEFSHLKVSITIAKTESFKPSHQSDQGDYLLSRIIYLFEFKGDNINVHDYCPIRYEYLQNCFKFADTDSDFDKIMCLMIDDNHQLKSLKEQKIFENIMQPSSALSPQKSQPRRL